MSWIAEKHQNHSVDSLRPTASKLNTTRNQQSAGLSVRNKAPSLSRFKPTTSGVVQRKAQYDPKPNNSSALIMEESRLRQGTETNVLDLRREDDEFDDAEVVDEAISGEDEIDSQDGDDEEEMSAAMVDEIMESTGLSRTEVEALLGDYTQDRKSKPPKATKSSPKREEERFFVTETPDIPEQITLTADSPENSKKEVQQPMRPQVTPRNRQSALLEEFLPSGGVSTSHRDSNYDAEMEEIALKREERKRKKEAAVTGYLKKRRGTVSVPSSLTERTPLVEKYEREMKLRKQSEEAKLAEKLAREKEERRERRIKGFFSNMAIQEKITAAQKKKEKQQDPRKDATPTDTDTPLDLISSDSPRAADPPHPGNVAPFVSDDCCETVGTIKENA